MTKTCPICNTEFTTRDSRTVTCGSAECANQSRSVTNKVKSSQTATQVSNRIFLREGDLPPVECLPAAYLKKVADYWSDLTGDEIDTQKRIL